MTDPRRCPACGFGVAAGLQVCPNCQGAMPADQTASVLISFVPGMKTGGQGAPASVPPSAVPAQVATPPPINGALPQQPENNAQHPQSPQQSQPLIQLPRLQPLAQPPQSPTPPQPLAQPPALAYSPVEPQVLPPPPMGWKGPFGGAAAPVEQAIPAATTPRAVDLVFDTGQKARVSGPSLLGRNPESADPALTCIAVEDPAMSVSKTHMEVGIDEQGFWVKDRGSTNGSALMDGFGQAHKLEPGVIARSTIGGTVAIGYRRFRVEEVG